MVSHSGSLTELFLKVNKSPIASDFEFLFADESLVERNKWGFLKSLNTNSKAIYLFIGPEGGWSENERKLLGANPRINHLALGPKVLRVPVATAAALTLINENLGI